MNGVSAECCAALISFRQLQLFESVARLQSFRRAAEECNLSQPAVTQALAKLEEQIGAELLKRSVGGSYLNKLGSIFYRRVARFAAMVEQAIAELGVPGGAAAAPVFAKRLSRSKVRGLIAVIESPDLARASAGPGPSQASLQRAAHNLEWDLQRQLYHRAGDGITATQAGIQFGRAIKRAMQEIEWGVAEIQAELASFNGRILVGAMPLGGSRLMALALDEFVARYPRVDVQIINGHSTVMLNMLRSANVDFVIGLLQQEPAADLVTDVFARTPYVIAARRGHRILSKGRVTTEDLQAYEWVVGRPGSRRRGYFDALFAVAPPPRASIMTSSVPVIRHLLEQSDRLTIMTSYELEHETDMLVKVPFMPLEREPAPMIGITTRAGWHPTEWHADLIGLIRRKMMKPSKAFEMMRLSS